MSLLLTRRIAQAALLFGAAAAPLAGAGAAHAAAPAPALGSAVDSASQHAAQATDAAGRIIGATTESLPIAGALPNTGTLPTTDQLPLKALPLG